MAETFYGTGKRKDAIARVWLVPGSGQITVNNKPLEEYFPRVALQQIARSPLAQVATSSGYDVKATARGGGNFEMTMPKDLTLSKGDQVVLPGLNSYVLGVVQTIISDPRDPFAKALLVSPVNIQELKFVEVEL